MNKFRITAIISLNEQTFNGIYICFNACNLGFTYGFRKVVGVNGSHLCGCFGRIMLTVVWHDANDFIYPVAYAVVQKENTRSQRWFIKYLANDIEMDNGNG